MSAGAKQRYDLAVIGGGQSAKAILMALAERALQRGAAVARRVAVFERSQAFGTGFAWSPDVALEEHLASQPTGYPRARYGREQIRQFLRLIPLLREAGIDVDLFPRTEITHAEIADGGWRLCSENDTWRARSAVLATGHWPDRPHELSHVPYHDPWPSKSLQAAVASALDRGPDVGIVGSYLTAVDVAITIALAAGGFEGDDATVVYRPRRPIRIKLLSRRGRLPWTWPATFKPGTLVSLTERTLTAASVASGSSQALPLDGVARLLARELGAGETGMADPLRWLARASDRIARGGPWQMTQRALCADSVPWLNALAAALPVLSEWFHCLDAADYARFQRLYRSSFLDMAMPMARQSARRLLALRRAGCLDVVRIVNPKWEVRDGRVTCAMPAGDLAFDMLVNGRAGGGDISCHPSPLIRSMVARGLIQPARVARTEANGTAREVLRGNGILVDHATCEALAAQHHDGRDGGRLYAMGPNVTGQFLDAQSIGQTLRDAQRIVSHMAAHDEVRTEAQPCHER